MYLKGGQILIGNDRVVQILKEKNLLPKWVRDDFPLPPDPENKLIFVRKKVNNKLSFVATDPSGLTMEKYMNYQEMTEKVREGAHARRATWKADEKLWSDGKILIHNTPYFGEPFNQGIQGYPYVCEQVDVFATDWELCAAC